MFKIIQYTKKHLKRVTRGLAHKILTKMVNYKMKLKAAMKIGKRYKGEKRINIRKRKVKNKQKVRMMKKILILFRERRFQTRINIIKYRIQGKRTITIKMI